MEGGERLKLPWNREVRTEQEAELTADLLKALIGNTVINKENALKIPAVKSCINFIADTVAMVPLYMYQDNKDKTKAIEDYRVKLLNDETGDTLDSVQFWRAIIEDYFLGKGGYAYINRELNTIKSLHYVDESVISIIKNNDPIFKKYNLYVNGKEYWPHEFIKILRNTKDGAEGKSMTEESDLILSVFYNSLIFEETIVKKGGNKKGFIKSQRKLGEEAMKSLKKAWNNLYGNNTDNVVILNEGLSFQEASNTSVEMQLNENKATNSVEICKLFNISENIIKGTGTRQDYINSIKMGVLPVMSAIVTALNKELLLEEEKGSLYFAFDTKELLKGDTKERYEAYKTAIDANFMSIDEVRYLEDLPSLGISWIKLGLDSVLYDSKNKTIYTPNTNQISDITESKKGGEEN